MRIFLRLCVMGILVGGALPSAVAGQEQAALEPDVTIARDGAAQFIEQLTTRMIAELTGSVPLTERGRRFRAILADHFDLDGISRYALGRHWDKATEPEKLEYRGLFENVVIRDYAWMFANFSNGQSYHFLSARMQGAQGVVSGEVRRPNDQPMRFDWRVRAVGDGTFKVVDVVVGGISLALLEREEYESTLRRTEGRIEGLLTALRDKTR